MAHALNKGGTVTVDGVKLTLTDANHSSSAPDGSYAGEPSGIVVELEDGTTLYFAGDTCVFGDMQLIGRIYEPDVAVLPIGDHFTMGPREAAVALELLGVKRCVPCHYGTFPLLTGTPDELRQLAPGRRGTGARSPGDDRALRSAGSARPGRRVPEIAVEGELELPADVLWAEQADADGIKAAHAARTARRRAHASTAEA